MDNTRFNKLLNEKYFLMQDIAKSYNYSEELLDMITFIYLSFYMDFGKICDFPLHDLFNKVKIIYEHGNVSEIARRNNFDMLLGESTAACTIFEPNLEVFKNPSLKQKPQTILLGTHVENYLATPILKLEMLTHEVRHALMGYYNTNILLDKNTYYMRTGVKETYYIRDNNAEKSYSTKKIGVTLDEITNTFITELLVNRILSFKKYNIENNNLREYLKLLKVNQSDGKYRALGYNSEVKLLYPLLLNKMFINLFNQHQFDGDIDIIKKFIESCTSICNYEEFCSLLDTIFYNNAIYTQEVKKNNLDFIQSHINNINSAKSIVMDINKSLIKQR